MDFVTLYISYQISCYIAVTGRKSIAYIAVASLLYKDSLLLFALIYSQSSIMKFVTLYISYRCYHTLFLQINTQTSEEMKGNSFNLHHVESNPEPLWSEASALTTRPRWSLC